MYIELQNAVKKYKSENVETLALNGISLGIETVSYTHLTLPTIA